MIRLAEHRRTSCWLETTSNQFIKCLSNYNENGNFRSKES
jgi:hypothetical protein